MCLTPCPGTHKSLASLSLLQHGVSADARSHSGASSPAQLAHLCRREPCGKVAQVCRTILPQRGSSCPTPAWHREHWPQNGAAPALGASCSVPSLCFQAALRAGTHTPVEGWFEQPEEKPCRALAAQTAPEQRGSPGTAFTAKGKLSSSSKHPPEEAGHWLQP